VILCDSGPLIAAAASNDADHHACTEMFTGLRLAGRRLLVPQTVVAEVGYMLAGMGEYQRSRQSSSTRSPLKTSKSST
jgi:predicted nucleic acid-binding protein